MATAAEKRAELEKKLAELSEKDVATRIAEQRKKLQEEITRLEVHKDLEGKSALWDIEGDGSCMVRVLIVGFARKAFGRDLFSVSPMDGEGSTNVAHDRLKIE